MNKIEQSISELYEIDDLAAGNSMIHRRSAGAKLAVTVLYILLVMSFHKYDLPGLVPMVFYPVILFQLSGIPVSLCFKKLRYVLPVVCAVGIVNPFLDRTPVLYLGGAAVTGGMISFLTLLLKGVFCLQASFLLISTTRIEEICAALRKIRVPSLFVTLLLLTYRYVTVMAEEVLVMTQAYSLRAPGQKGIHYSAWGSFLGKLLIRSRDRAQELYSAMLLRGYRGEFPHAQSAAGGFPDVAYTLVWTAFLLFLRYVDLSTLAGGLLI